MSEFVGCLAWGGSPEGECFRTCALVREGQALHPWRVCDRLSKPLISRSHSLVFSVLSSLCNTAGPVKAAYHLRTHRTKPWYRFKSVSLSPSREP